jgi:amino acid transporter
MGLVFFSSIICSSNSPQLLNATTKSGSSPFTIALVNAGWDGAGNLVNAVILISLLSSANSSIYIASRTLLSLAKLGRAPKFFAVTTENGVPIRAIVFSNLFGLISLLNASAGAGQVFTYLVDISGAATFIAWAFIGITHIRFRRAYVRQGLPLEDLPFKALLYPYGAYFVAFINIFLLLISGYTTLLHPFQAVNFVFSYVVIPIFLGLYVFWKFYKRTKFVNLLNIDLVSGRRQFLVVQGVGEEKTEGKVLSILTQAKRILLG